MIAPALAACGATAHEATSFTYWSMWKENEPQAHVLAQAIADFKRDTGITVDVRWQGREVLTKLADDRDAVPDLVDQENTKVRAALVASRGFRDLAPVLSAQVPGMGRTVGELISPKYLESLRQDGQMFLMPYEVIGHGLWFDGSAMAAVADEPPRTWNELAALMAKCRKAGRAPIALDADISGYGSYWTIGALQGALGPGKVRELARDRTGRAWERPDVREAVTRVKSFVDLGYFDARAADSRWPSAQLDWARHKTDFLLMGSWTPSEIGPSAVQGFQFRFVPLPGASTAVPVSTIGFAIPATAGRASLAERFIAHFFKDGTLSKIATVAKNLTPNPELPAPDDLADVGRALAALPVSQPLDGILEITGYAAEVFEPVNDELLKGRIDVAGFVAELVRRQADYWRKNS
ncbi:hypothetical protein UK23_08490 [Lentzea aerocolonigenes]|uniref:ABC transporter substrate-binding protein n=1 Tax=Lentzea aerocolonigenes TaxID=68170 RepID=A0A0F0H9M0_LENAE|nr:hypothetical protein UK23_08490 [Lentzea aerocolonigenes]